MDPLLAELMRSVGVAGALVVALVVMGIFIPGKVYHRMEERYDNLQAQREVEQQKLIDDIVPLMTRGIEAMSRLQHYQQRRNMREQDEGDLV